TRKQLAAKVSKKRFVGKFFPTFAGPQRKWLSKRALLQAPPKAAAHRLLPFPQSGSLPSRGRCLRMPGSATDQRQCAVRLRGKCREQAFAASHLRLSLSHRSSGESADVRALAR